MSISATSFRLKFSQALSRNPAAQPVCCRAAEGAAAVYARHARLPGTAISVLGLVLFVTLVLFVPPANAQRHPPEARGVYPVGGSVGATTRITISGASLRGASRLLFDRVGITATLVSPDPARLSAPTIDSDGNPDAAADVTVAASTAPGLCYFRVVSLSGVSSAKRWMVGRNLPQVEEKEPNNDIAQAQPVRLPVAVNGHIGETGDQDTYAVELGAGQAFVAEAQAGRVGSPLDALLTLRDTNGQQVASNDDHYGSDSLLVFTPRAAGRYYVTLASSDGQSGANHAYRLEMGALPLVTAIYPAAYQTGQAGAVTILGLNLTNGTGEQQVRVPLGAAEAAGTGRVFVATGRNGGSNSLPVLYSLMPAILEREPNDDPAHATLLLTPGIANGRFWHGVNIARQAKPTQVKLQEAGTQRAGTQTEKAQKQKAQAGKADFENAQDVDYYKFAGEAGQRYVFDVRCQALGSPADPVLTLYGPDGKQIAENDDTNGRDSHLDMILPASGQYRLRVAETRGKSGPEYVYCLSVQMPPPGFALALETRARCVGQGNVAPLEVSVTRDRWDGSVVLGLGDLPPGVTATTCVVPPGVSRGLLLISASPNAPLDAFALHIVGTAQIQGTTVQHTPDNVTDWVWNGGPRLSVPVPRGLLDFAVCEPNEIAPTVDTQSIALARGQSAIVKVKLARRGGYAKPVTLRVLGLPDGVTAADVIVTGDKSEGTLELKAAPTARLGNAPISVDCVVSAAPTVQLDRVTPLITLTVADPPKAK